MVGVFRATREIWQVILLLISMPFFISGCKNSHDSHHSHQSKSKKEELNGRQSFDEEANKSVRYPFVTFEDRDKQRELIAAIREKAPAFIEARLADTEHPLKFQGRLKINPGANKQTRHQVLRKKKEVAAV